MRAATNHLRASAVLAGVCLTLAAATIVAQQGPVAAMFADDQKRDASLAASFTLAELPASSAAASPLKIYLSAGDLERAFDRAEFRPDAAIVPTNTDLQMIATAPATQKVLIDRVQKQPDAMRRLQEQIAARRSQPAATTGVEPGLLRIGIDHVAVRLEPAGQTQGAQGQPAAAFPKGACFVATDFASGGAVERRALFVADRMRQGIAGCLEALDAAGATSIVLPLMGASSSNTQNNDVMYEGQRQLKECRLINSTAGIAMGIHDFAERRRNVREIGVVQWDQEIVGMFKVPPGSRAERSAREAYAVYAAQVKDALQKGLAGRRISPNDLKGNCGAILTGQ